VATHFSLNFFNLLFLFEKEKEAKRKKRNSTEYLG
jgi:hypothetical protein